MTRAAYWLLVIVGLFPLNLARGADLVCAVGDQAPSRPYVFTTDEQLSRACDRINAKTEPFYTSYRSMIARANSALDAPVFITCETRKFNDPTRVTQDYWKVYCGPNHTTFYKHMTFQGRYARDLAVAYQVTGDTRYADRAIEILDGWASQGRRYPESGTDDCGVNGDICFHSAGLVLGEAAVVFGEAYALVYEMMSGGERTRILNLLASFEPHIHESRRQWETHNWFWDQRFNNHLSAHNMGLVTIGYLTGNLALKNYAINSTANDRDFREMINGAIYQNGDRLDARDPSLDSIEPTPWPQPLEGEIYDRYRTAYGRSGNGYAALHMRFLAVTAEIIIANGQTNYWPYVAPGGERLKWVFTRSPYSVLVSTGNPAASTGYYAKDTVVDLASWMFLFELGAHQWPGDNMINDALRSRKRVYTDTWFGASFLLTHGKSGLPAMWHFNRSMLEGWTFKRMDAAVANGLLSLTIKGKDPQMVSPDLLSLRYNWFDEVRIRMKNQTDDTAAQLFFRTNQEGEETFSADKKFGFSIVANDTGFRIYVIRVADHAKWEGYIEQLRLDVVNSATDGQVQIDWIHFYKNGKLVNR